jgi:histidinol-phosphate aminotransferase
MMTPPALPTLAAATAFPAPAPGRARAGLLRLDMSEALMPAPADVREALKALLSGDAFSAYPEEAALYPALAGFIGVPPSHLLATNGSDHAISLILRAFLAAGERLKIIDPSFPIYAHVAAGLGAAVDPIPLNADYGFDPERFLAGAAGSAGPCVLVNPNNPTGTLIPLDQVRAVAAALGDRPLIVDEAYVEYSGRTAVPLLDDHPNLIITRTFSKAFGLAGLRLGCIIAQPAVIDELRKLRLPFDVNAFAIAAALAHLADPAAMRAYVDDIVNTAKPALCAFLDGLDIRHHPSAANFVLLELAERDAVAWALAADGVLVAPQRHPRLAQAIRVAVPPSAHRTRFETAFRQALMAPG